MIKDRKYLTPSQKKRYRNHLGVRSILVDVLPHSEYINIIDLSDAQTISEKSCDQVLVGSVSGSLNSYTSSNLFKKILKRLPSDLNLKS